MKNTSCHSPSDFSPRSMDNEARMIQPRREEKKGAPIIVLTPRGIFHWTKTRRRWKCIERRSSMCCTSGVRLGTRWLLGFHLFESFLEAIPGSGLVYHFHRTFALPCNVRQRKFRLRTHWRPIFLAWPPNDLGYYSDLALLPGGVSPRPQTVGSSFIVSRSLKNHLKIDPLILLRHFFSIQWRHFFQRLNFPKSSRVLFRTFACATETNCLKSRRVHSAVYGYSCQQICSVHHGALYGWTKTRTRCSINHWAFHLNETRRETLYHSSLFAQCK